MRCFINVCSHITPFNNQRKEHYPNPVEQNKNFSSHVLKPLLGGEFYVLEQFKISLRLILCYYRKTLKNCYQSQLFKLTLHLYQAPESILLSGLMLVTQRLRHLIFNPR